MRRQVPEKLDPRLHLVPLKDEFVPFTDLLLSLERLVLPMDGPIVVVGSILHLLERVSLAQES